jgi:hypothetical protein
VINDDQKSVADRIVEAMHRFAREHPTVGWLDLMNMHDSASSSKELGEWLADPEAWMAAQRTE